MAHQCIARDPVELGAKAGPLPAVAGEMAQRLFKGDCGDLLRQVSVAAAPVEKGVDPLDMVVIQQGKGLRIALNNYTPPADDLLLFQHPWLAKVRPWWEEAYTKMVKGEASAAEALDAAQQQAEAYRTCVIAATAFTDEAQQQSCAAAVGLPGQ